MRLAMVYIDNWGEVGRVDIIDSETEEVIETLPFQKVGFQWEFDYSGEYSNVEED